MKLIDAEKIGLTDFEILMCNGDFKEALKMYINKVEKAPTVNAIPIPENATNGEIMCLLFPNTTLDKVLCIDMEWWNAPYKENK